MDSDFVSAEILRRAGRPLYLCVSIYFNIFRKLNHGGICFYGRFCGGFAEGSPAAVPSCFNIISTSFSKSSEYFCFYGFCFCGKF